MPISGSSPLSRKLLSTEQKHPPLLSFTPQVKRSRSKGGLAGPDGTKSVFGQMCAKMSSFSPDSLLLPHRVWKVKFVGRCSSQMSSRFSNKRSVLCKLGNVFVHSFGRILTNPSAPVLSGESVDDCGGGYSESIAEMCEELQNALTPLLIVTPNGRDESGANRDCFLLNPAAKSPLHMSMFRFLGIIQLISRRALLGVLIQDKQKKLKKKNACLFKNAPVLHEHPGSAVRHAWFVRYAPVHGDG